MKKIAVSLFSLAALSTAAFAGESRSYDLRDSDTYFGKYSNQMNDSSTSTNAITVMDSVRPLTNFERLMLQSEENQNGGK
ncbi:MAG: hypothetical protein Q8L53_00150 [Aestuariivirga sp.]|nr:hypothetical protein [Aestuariivirga sp.]